jgi:hypothetical protein
MDPVAFNDPDHRWVNTDRARERRDWAKLYASRVLAAGYVRAESVASALEDRARERDAADDGQGETCHGDCGNDDCHRIAAVATWQRAAVQVRGSVSGGGNATK